MEPSVISVVKQTNEEKPWLFKPGVSGNPKGRPKGSKTLKTYVAEMLKEMDDEDKVAFLKGLPKRVIWEMAEGKPKQDVGLSGHLTISEVLDKLDGQTPSEQGVENQPVDRVEGTQDH